MGSMDLGNNVEGQGTTDNAGIGDGSGDPSTSTTTTDGGEPADNDNLTSDVEKTTPVKSNTSNNTNASENPDPKTESELDKALDIFNKNKGNDGGDGNANQPGDKGDPKGSPDGGDFPGHNKGQGPDGWSMKGRKMVKFPDPVSDSQEQGKVVVAIVVDASGKVIKAEPGEPGSTTSSAILYAKARQAALTAKFNPSPEGFTEQRGTITFVFILK